jgi:streptomycin 6-kinase
VTGRDVAALARTGAEVASTWGLRLGQAFELARYSFVAPAGGDAVLKVTPAADDEADEEADALALWAGDGAVRLLRHDHRRRALLLERARPGHDISQRAEDEAMQIAIEVAHRLWVPAGVPFRWIGDHVPRWLASAERRGGAGSSLVPLARRLYEQLDVARSTLVHGDFHHHNILDAGDRHVAIDPKPMLGEPEYDVPSFLWNPLPYRMRLDVTERRIAAFAASGLDESRIRRWAVIRGAYLGADEDEARILRSLV